jgi:4'-phosphopantetheinyl transferase
VTASDIPPGEVHVWCWSLAVNDDELARALSLLDERELERAERLRVPAVRRRFIAARAALRSVLGECTGTDPAAVSFAYGERGKPRLADGGPHFNASDSGDWAVVALADAELGIDLEVVRELRNADSLARRICTDRELERFERLPESERDAALLRLWTCKEAGLKAVGLGLSGGLRNVELELGADRSARLRRLCGEVDGWALLAVDLGPELECSVIVRSTGRPELRMRSRVGRSSDTMLE